MSRARAATPAGRRRATAQARAPGAPATPKAASRGPKPKRAASRRRAAAKPKPADAASAARRRARPQRGRAEARPRAGAAAPAAAGPARRRDALARRVAWRYRRGGARDRRCSTAAAGYFFWLRDSSLVAVTDVEVVGVTSGDRATIVAELTRQSPSR